MAGPAVPWNASWSAEMAYEVRPCRWAEGRLAIWQPTAAGQGKPLFANPHMVRQRRAVAKMLCTVCGEPTLAHDRWLFPFGERRHIERRMRWLTTETPVHRACADHALQACPHIRKGGWRPSRFPDDFGVIYTLVGGPEVERDFRLTIPPTRPVIGSMKLALPDWWVSLALGAAQP